MTAEDDAEIAYVCGQCGEEKTGMSTFVEHAEEEHEYEHASAAVKDCEWIYERE